MNQLLGGVASADNRYELLHTPYVEDEDKNLIFDITVTSVPREMKSYERIDLPKVDKSDIEEGEYHLDLPGRSTLVRPSVECTIAWKNRDKQKSRSTCFSELLFIIARPHSVVIVCPKHHFATTKMEIVERVRSRAKAHMTQ